MSKPQATPNKTRLAEWIDAISASIVLSVIGICLAGGFIEAADRQIANEQAQVAGLVTK